jgi:predicted trehalose synthase
MIIVASTQVRVFPDKTVQQWAMRITNEIYCMPNVEELPKVALSMNWILENHELICQCLQTGLTRRVHVSLSQILLSRIQKLLTAYHW